MKLSKRATNIWFGCLFAAALSISSVHAQIIFSFNLNDSGNGITMSGTFDANSLGSGKYAILSLSGSVLDTNVSSSPENFTGLSLYGGSDNTLLYPKAPQYVDANGIGFSTTSTQYNLYDTGSGLGLLDTQGGNFLLTSSTFAVTESSAPEPSTWAMLLCGMGLLFFCRRACFSRT